ncbi:MAG: MerR family transcriptional regulator [Helicobacteraceae bacterium]|nr:MerR family transcriptional regulator [Helicobacteraceae bacterium]
MAYTIIEVQKQTGIYSRTLRFWLTKGLFPYVQKDKNGVNYFSKSDVEFAVWVEFFRFYGMSIKQIKAYNELCSRGKESIPQRLEIIKKQKKIMQNETKKLQEATKKLECKIKTYEEMLQKQKDKLNPRSKDYKSCGDSKNW